MPIDLLQVAEEAARAAGEILLSRFRSGELQAREKARNDLVTAVDGECEEAIRRILAARCPGHAVLAEEGGWSGESGESVWIVDPLDGTANFVQGLPLFAVSIACRHEQELVVGVILDALHGELFRAERGAGARCGDDHIRVSTRSSLEGAFLATGFPFRARKRLDLYLRCFRRVFLSSRGLRRCGSAALDLAWTAAGRFDGFFEFGLSPWDLAAGALLIQEAGGRVTDVDGGAGYLEHGNVVAGTPGVHSALLEIVGETVSDAELVALGPEVVVEPH